MSPRTVWIAVAIALTAIAVPLCAQDPQPQETTPEETTPGETEPRAAGPEKLDPGTAQKPKEAPKAPRAYLGLVVGPLPDALRSHLGIEQGAMVHEVVAESAAAKAGLHQYDVIVSLDGKPVADGAAVRERVKAAKPGDVLPLTVRRGGTTQEMKVSLGEAPSDIGPMRDVVVTKRRTPGFLGIYTAELPGDLAHHLGIKDGEGVLVGDVLKDSAAQKAGIEAKDVILAVDGKTVESPEDFVAVLGAKKAGDEVKLDVIHRGEKKALTVVLGERPKSLPGLSPFGPAQNRPFFRRVDPLHRGKIFLWTPDGEEHAIEIPDAFFKAKEGYEEALRRAEELFQNLEREKLPQIRHQLRLGLKALHDKLDDEEKLDGERADDLGGITSSHNVSELRIRGDDGIDIAVRDEDGARSVTVSDNGKPIATNLPLEQLDQLPPKLQARVRKAADGLHTTPPSVKRSTKKLRPKASPNTDNIFDSDKIKA